MGRSFQASKAGLEKAEQAFQIKGCTQEYLAGSVGCTRQVIISFFARRPVDKHYFQSICSVLKLEWGDIADLESEYKEDTETEKRDMECATPQTKSNENKYGYAIVGSVSKDNVQKLKTIVALLQQITGDTSIEIVDLDKGSIRLILDGSQEGLEQIEALFKSGQLNDLLGISVLDVQFLTTNILENGEDIQKNNKTRLAFTIASNLSEVDIQKLKVVFNQENISQVATGQNQNLTDYRRLPFRYQNLRNRNLLTMPKSRYSGQDLRKQHFAGQDLRGHDFSDADLREANFAGATLYEANFSGANVRGANFTKAKLDKADFSNAKIQGANFHQAKLRSSKFPKASVDDTSSLPSVDFSKAEIQGTNFTDALLNHADFTAVQAGLTRFWSFILCAIHIFGCSISGFTATISITFLVCFFRAFSKKPSFFNSIFIGIISVLIIVTLRTFILNSYSELVFPSVLLGIVAIIFVFLFSLVTAITSEEERFFSSIMTVILLFIILLITTNTTMFASSEDWFSNEKLRFIIHHLGSKTKNNPNGTNGTWLSMVLSSIVGAIFGGWFSRSAINENTQFNWLWKIYVRLATTGGTTFNQADLTNACFTSANLKGVNFKNAIITGVLWYRAKSLERARLGNNYLKLPQVRELVVRLDGKGQNFNELNLEGVNLETPNFAESSNSLERTNLSSASFIGTNLNKAKLRNADLRYANLKQANLNGANLTEACLTGAIIEGWNIDKTTILDNVKCEFIFLKERPDPESGIQQRLPHPPNIFNPGDFEKIFVGEHNTVQLLIRHEQNRQALIAAFEHLVRSNPDITPDDFREFRRIDNDVLVTIRVPQSSEGVVEQEFEQVYQQVKQESPSNSRSGELENQPLFEFILKLIKTLGENMSEKREINFHGNDNRYIENNGTYVERDYINMSQDLTKAASQIQDLIEQLQKRGVTVDVAQTQVAENIAVQAKKDSTMKEKLAKWGQSLGDATVSDVVKGVVKLAIRSAGIPLP